MDGETIRIRNIEAAPGARAEGFLQLGETPSEPIRAPLVVINGERPGPRLCLTAGVHAAEYPAIDAVMRTIQELEPATLAGAVVAVPVVNPPMFQRRSGFLSPIDGLNLNRTAPGRPDGTMSERLAHVLLTEVIGACHYHIDCHGGDQGEILWPYAGFALTGNPAVDEPGAELARLYSPQIVALYRPDSSLPPTPGALTAEAARRGVVSILAEAGSNLGLDPVDVEIHRRGIRNVMRQLGMIAGEPEPNPTPLYPVDQFIVSVRRGGLLRLQIGIGDEIRAGQEIADVVNLFGEVVERIHAPRAGIARLIWAHKAVNSGDPVVKCWVVEGA
ncbi:MAG TPA: succinylglutamate desuccinylase/aspartoacylase family protein [Thermomicrobiales bacterium]|nr:succinylglutamate desuccinylase/aspartoacylase family protein [Thermomicrobiales bacterium]